MLGSLAFPDWKQEQEQEEEGEEEGGEETEEQAAEVEVVSAVCIPECSLSHVPTCHQQSAASAGMAATPPGCEDSGCADLAEEARRLGGLSDDEMAAGSLMGGMAAERSWQLAEQLAQLQVGVLAGDGSFVC